MNKKNEGNKNNPPYTHPENKTTIQDPLADIYRLDPEELSVIENLPFERIPGLPYTHEERINAVRETMAEIDAGVSGIDSDEVYQRLQRFYNND
ncbi:hypothetical protein LJC44_00825 [Parabacteroides sp. OttesenSCG-928-G06]|nr:hypothetical protein [Parabacteroides sp. OttesenSCG-928-G06]